MTTATEQSASNLRTAGIAVMAAVVLVAAAFLAGRVTADAAPNSFTGTVDNVSGDGSIVAITPSDGNQISGVLAYDGRELQPGDEVEGTVFATKDGGSVVFIASN